MSCQSVSPFAKADLDESSTADRRLLALKIPVGMIGMNSALPSLEPEILQPEEFVFKYRPVAEISEPLSKGRASWYGPNFHGRLTANGERYNMHELTAAHRSLPFNTLVWVENKQNGRGVMVRINDRGPYANNRIIDLSKGAARELKMLGSGVVDVQLYVVDNGSEVPDVANDHKLYTIQLGVFKKGVKAFEYAEQLDGARVEVFHEHNRKYYGVFYGHYSERDEALQKRRELADQQFTGHIRELEMS